MAQAATRVVQLRTLYHDAAEVALQDVSSAHSPLFQVFLGLHNWMTADISEAAQYCVQYKPREDSLPEYCRLTPRYPKTQNALIVTAAPDNRIEILTLNARTGAFDSELSAPNESRESVLAWVIERLDQASAVRNSLVLRNRR
jgi:hypothetical protein